MEARRPLGAAAETGETVATSQVKQKSSPTLKAALMGVLMATSAGALAACDKTNPAPVKPEATDSEKSLKAQKEACEDGFGGVTNTSNARAFVKILDTEGETAIVDVCGNKGKGHTLVSDALCENFSAPKDGVKCDAVEGNQDWTVTVGGREYVIYGDENRAAPTKGPFKRDKHKTWKKATGMEQYCSDGDCEETDDDTKFTLGHNLKQEEVAKKPEPKKPAPVPTVVNVTPQKKCDPCETNKRVDKVEVRLDNLEATVARHDAELDDHEERINAIELTPDIASEIIARGHAKKKHEGQQ